MKAKLKVIVCAVIVAVVALLLNNVLLWGLLKMESIYKQTKTYSDRWAFLSIVAFAVGAHAIIIAGGLFYYICRRKRYLSIFHAKIMLLLSKATYIGLMWGIFPIYYFWLKEYFYHTYGLIEFGGDLLLLLVKGTASLVTVIWACILLVLLALEYRKKKVWA